MFLQRKFPLTIAASPEFANLPEPIRDVVANLNLLLATRRGVGHILPDFGFTCSAYWSTEGTLTECLTELRENIGRYEPRLDVLDIDAELRPSAPHELVIEARVSGVRGVWRLVVNLGTNPMAQVVLASQL